MSDPAFKRMSVDEFLLWEDGTTTRYELIDGVPVAMAPSHSAHQIIVGNAARHIGNALDARPPCRVQPEAGILKPDSVRSFFQADLAVTCKPHAFREHAIPDPVLVMEVLSRSTMDHDRRIKLPVHRSIPSLREIVLVDSESLFVEVHRRLDEARWQVDLLLEPEAILRLDSVGAGFPLSALYRNVETGNGSGTGPGLDLGSGPTSIASGDGTL
ncbi:Uma2 family endonuclease [Azospirillum sp. SYSU D00513]|uniref:Uma2 family endonuclease n=1 Tax=Azospirillum sp. SYSU D00513 TaxID=2812561 RepID=UPI001A974513|nr:Uma2 family endonuclease [Azospirillum sp. SYSU D00513]